MSLNWRMLMKQLNDNKLGIKCEWMDTKRLLVNPDGQVLPCCFFANVIYMYGKMKDKGDKYALDKDDESIEKRVSRRKKFEEKISAKIENQIGDKSIINSETKNDNVLMDYYENKEQYNIFDNSLENIINSEWFTKTLPESWDDETKAPRPCKVHCMKKYE